MKYNLTKCSSDRNLWRKKDRRSNIINFCNKYKGIKILYSVTRTQKMTPRSYHKSMDKYLDIDTGDKIQKILTIIL